jgi:hypothetical protein
MGKKTALKRKKKPPQRFIFQGIYGIISLLRIPAFSHIPDMRKLSEK